MDRARIRLVAKGQVQGVGFRPFVYNRARQFDLTGFVRNAPEGVVIEVQGDAENVQAFHSGFCQALPPLARLTGLDEKDLPHVDGERAFLIIPSTAGDEHAVLVSPDMAPCEDCLRDMAQGRRSAYPFTNCTNCGPRYTITRSIPYDRATTSMGCFPLCPQCAAEYKNPEDRRFHAQPNACPQCGPAVWLVDPARLPSGTPLPSNATAMPDDAALTQDHAFTLLARLLLSGKTAAIKGLGGFHLACDACDERVVALLRERKNRPHKPFAVMADSLEELRSIVHIGVQEKRLLTSAERPVVICPVKPEAAPWLAPGLAPDSATLGVMLPSTPLHHTLFHALRREAGATGRHLPLLFVMTSGNRGGEPICLGNREALSKLEPMADCFLLHNRDILIRADDSVLRVLPSGDTLFLRRARGYVPSPISLPRLSPMPEQTGTRDVGPPQQADPCIFGAGAELKGTLCFTKGDDAFVSQHIGDLSNVETASFYEEIRDHMAQLLRVRPTLAVRDLHPDFMSTRLAEEYADELSIPLINVQHHTAHAYAVLGEHAVSGSALVLALDGTGLGEDGALWGGEAILTDMGKGIHTRVGTLRPVPLPGGEAAIREPWRIAYALLLHLKRIVPGSPVPFFANDETCAEALRHIPAMLERRINTLFSSSCGRLLDAASALLGLCDTISYEGQAAIRLEEAQEWAEYGTPEKMVETYGVYPCPVEEFVTEKGNSLLRLNVHALFAALYDDIQQTDQSLTLEKRRLFSRRFHASLCVGLCSLAATLCNKHGLRTVGLSGGCLNNLTFATLLPYLLQQQGLTALLHKDLPPGDACISYGQAVYGRLRSAAGRE